MITCFSKHLVLLLAKTLLQASPRGSLPLAPRPSPRSSLASLSPSCVDEATGESNGIQLGATGLVGMLGL